MTSPEPEVTSPEPEVTSPEPEVTSWQPKVTWFGWENRGLRLQTPNQAPGEVLTGKGSDKEDAMLEKNDFYSRQGVTNGNADPSPEIKSKQVTAWVTRVCLGRRLGIRKGRFERPGDR